MKDKWEKRLEIVSKISADLDSIPDGELIAKFFAYVRGSLSTFVDHPIGEEKPSYITAIDYILSIATYSKIDDLQKEIFKEKWLKFRDHISEFERVNEKVLEEKNVLILSALDKEKKSTMEGIIDSIRETLPSNCGDIWKETQEHEDVLRDREWSRACSISQSTGYSPWLFLD